jgi:predicted O-linked N-acetylglucosamine transferase (SPINDLY family)
VLLDAGGLTQNMPIDIYGAALSRKVVNYLGYPAPLGSTTHDFIMMAPYCVGHDTLAEEDEKPLLMNCMPLPRDPGLTPSDKVFSKEELGIDPDAFVFGSFCHVHKLTQEVFHGWLQVLQRREKSVLYLGGVSDVAKPVLKTVAEQHGVNSNRIIYAHRIEDHRDHLARLRVIDLFLDTYPYGGHTTVSDAISAAVPVVTRSGKVMQSRIAAAQLAYIGLNRCIVHNMQEYINETVRLSQSPAELEEIRKVMASINYHDEAKIYLNAFIQAIDSVI